jgi:hypothetical protein
MSVYEFGLNFARTNKFLQTEVSALSPRVAFLDHQRSLLTLGNSHLKQRIAALAQDKIFKDGDRHCRPTLPRLRSSPVAIAIQFALAACMQCNAVMQDAATAVC